jgi:thiamine-monophosphate kinase
MREFDVIRRIASLAAQRKSHPALITGIGDDCAVIQPAARTDLVFTTDFLIEDRHFKHETHTARAVGHKALARSLSDLAAMGAEPVFCLVSVALPPHRTSRWIDGFYRGVLALADQHRISLAGGDLSQADRVIADVMCCGSVPRGKALLRSGAKPGDRIFVTGKLGRAAASNWRVKPVPRLETGISLRGLATAAMDLSDGLSLDLRRLCLASGVSASLTGKLPIASGATLDQALHGGEDYELLFTARSSTRKRIAGSTEVGVIQSGEPGLILFEGKPLLPGGFDHFA